MSGTVAQNLTFARCLVCCGKALTESDNSIACRQCERRYDLIEGGRLLVRDAEHNEDELRVAVGFTNAEHTGFSPPDFAYYMRPYEPLDSLYEWRGRTFLPWQSASPYVIATRS